MKKAVENKKEQYYRQMWPKIILAMVPYKKPVIALQSTLGAALSFGGITEDRVYLYFDFVRPGKTDFVVKHTPEHYQEEAEKEEREAPKSKMMAALLGKKMVNP